MKICLSLFLKLEEPIRYTRKRTLWLVQFVGENTILQKKAITYVKMRKNAIMTAVLIATEADNFA